MPYYLLKITLRNSHVTGVKEMEQGIDQAGQILRYRAEKHYGSDFISMKVYGLEKNSKEVKAFLKRRAGHEPDDLPLTGGGAPRKRSSGPGKYRDDDKPNDTPFNKSQETPLSPPNN